MNNLFVNVAAFAFAECTLTAICHANKSVRDLFLCAYGSYGEIACHPFGLCEQTLRAYSHPRKSESKNEKDQRTNKTDKKINDKLKNIFAFASDFVQCEWALKLKQRLLIIYDNLIRHIFLSATKGNVKTSPCRHLYFLSTIKRLCVLTDNKCL